jgi:hypothetical protein
MSAAELERNLEVPTNHITEILNGRSAITGDTVLRLGHFPGTSPESRQNLKIFLRQAWPKTGRGHPSEVYPHTQPGKNETGERNSTKANSMNYGSRRKIRRDKAGLRSLGFF